MRDVRSNALATDGYGLFAPSKASIRRATETDWPAICAFLTETYGKTAPFKGKERWRWQFIDNPFRPTDDTEPTVWIAIYNNRVIGQIAVQDCRVEIHGSEIDAAWIVDVMVKPEYRGHGIARRIHDTIMWERPILLTLTMAPATRRIAEAAGCLTLGPTEQFVCLHRLRAATVRRYLALKEDGLGQWGATVRLFRQSKVGPWAIVFLVRVGTAFRRALWRHEVASRFEFEEVERFDCDTNLFWEEVHRAFPAIQQRSVRFLNWRFRDCPDLVYRRFLMRHAGRVRGYLIVRRARSIELPAGIVTDVLARPDDVAALDALLAHAHRVLADDVEYLEAAASTPLLKKVLRRHGFVAVRTMRPTIVTRNPKLYAQLKSVLYKWHFTKGDHDWDQIHPA